MLQLGDQCTRVSIGAVDLVASSSPVPVACTNVERGGRQQRKHNGPGMSERSRTAAFLVNCRDR